MAVMVERMSVASEARVTASALRAYAARYERVSEVSLTEMLSSAGDFSGTDFSGMGAVAASGLRIVEIALPPDVGCESLTSAVRILDSRGWQVSVLLPLHRLGEAHAILRGAPCRLQPWWIDDSEVCFGSYETP